MKAIWWCLCLAESHALSISHVFFTYRYENGYKYIEVFKSRFETPLCLQSSVDIDIDPEDQTYAHTAVEKEASETVSDDTDMEDADVKEALEHLKSLDSAGKLVMLRNVATDFERAFFIHQAVLLQGKGFEYQTGFSKYNPDYEKDPLFTCDILDAYSKRDYGTILSWRPERIPSVNESLPGNCEREAAKYIMARQYSVPYKGKVAEVFAKFVQSHARQGRHDLYANVIPVIQSSGTGKSRMLTEAGKTLFTLPFCAREKCGTGWPPGDNDMLAYILTSPDDQLSIKTHIIFIAFLAAIFAEMKHVLDSFGTSGLRQKWHSYMEPAPDATTIHTRDHFYANVSDRAKAIESEILSSDIPPLPRYSKDSDQLRCKFFTHLANCVKYLWKMYLNDKVIALLHTIPKNEVLLVYMDEAHTFGQRYWALQRVLSTLKDHKMLWFSFMGTDASLSKFVPAATNVKSYRIMGETLVLLPPYTALGFDQNMIDISPHQTVTMGWVRSLDWICAFGRPLWKARCTTSAGGGEDETPLFPVDEAAFFVDAKVKLLCSTYAFDWKNVQQVFAVLAYTVCPDLVLDNQKAIEFGNTSVAKHMRLLINVNDDRTTFFTQAPSEPVLALVAASIVANLENLPHIIVKLTSTIRKGLVDKGRHGELLARMILFLARIQACSSPSTPLGFATPVPVVYFLKTLFGELWNKTPGYERFEKDLEGGYVNFYHFALTREEMPVKEDLNFEANLWTRGTALQYSFRQVAIDGHIPIYWGPIDENDELDHSKFSSLDFQVKLKTLGDTILADKIQRPAGDRGSSNHPFIEVFLDMGSTQDYANTGSRLCLETGAESLQRLKGLDLTTLPRQRQKSTKQAIEALEVDPNRYCINACGCDEDVFGVLNTMDIAKEWKKLLEITVETPNAEEEIMETMRPLRRFDQNSGYCNWMKDYSASHNQTLQ